jgi:hypothetical protein
MSTIDSSIGIAGISFRPADGEQQETGTNTVTAVTGAAVASFVTSASTSGAASGISFTAAVGTAAGTATAGGSAATAATDNDLDTTDSSTTIKYWRVVRMDTTGGLQFETADGDGWKTLMRLDADL